MLTSNPFHSYVGVCAPGCKSYMQIIQQLSLNVDQIMIPILNVKQKQKEKRKKKKVNTNNWPGNLL